MLAFVPSNLASEIKTSDYCDLFDCVTEKLEGNCALCASSNIGISMSGSLMVPPISCKDDDVLSALGTVANWA